MEDALNEGENNKELEVAPALIAVHPTQDSVAVAVGSDLRVFDLREHCGVSLTDDSVEPFHKNSIRAIRYGANGKYFVSAGDDKLVKIWSTNSWRCISSVLDTDHATISYVFLPYTDGLFCENQRCSEKRVSTVAISKDGLYVCFADKFGVVWVVDLHGIDGSEASLNKKAAPLLAHYCSIITSLEFSPDGRFILSADRDFKIRVTVFPKNPLDGAHEIQTFCFGHTEYVSCLAFICTVDYPQGFLVSGSGDSTVRLWEIDSGFLLDTCEVGHKAGPLGSNGSEEGCSAVIDLCTIPGHNSIAVAIQRLQGIMLLSCDLSSQSINVAKVVYTGDNYIPTSLASSCSGELLWMITGVSKLHGSDYNSLARVRVLSGFSRSNVNSPEHEVIVLGDNEVPGAEKLLDKLQGSVSVKEEVFVAAAEAVKTAMCNLLIKKQYSAEKREFRKRTRNDKKNK